MADCRWLAHAELFFFWGKWVWGGMTSPLDTYLSNGARHSFLLNVTAVSCVRPQGRCADDEMYFTIHDRHLHRQKLWSRVCFFFFFWQIAVCRWTSMSYCFTPFVSNSFIHVCICFLLTHSPPSLWWVCTLYNHRLLASVCPTAPENFIPPLYFTLLVHSTPIFLRLEGGQCSSVEKRFLRVIVE